MVDLLPYPNINAKDAETQAKQINNYLIQLKEAIEFTLGSMSAENKSVSEALAKSLIESNAERENEITQKVSNGNLVSEINQSAEAIVLSGNRVIIDSSNFKLTKEGNIEILSGKIKINGTVTKYAKDYTQDDADKANRITIGTVEPTVADFERLDLNGDGVINVADSAMIQRLLDGTDTKREIDTSIEISPLTTHCILKTQGVAIGVDGIYSKNINSEKAYMKTVYAMKEGGGFAKGASGSYTSADGKTVTVTNGIITSIT